MKYLLDLESCLSKSEALFDKSGKEIFTLTGIKTYIGIPKGRTSPKLLDGTDIFYESNVQTIGSAFGLGLNVEKEFIDYLESGKANEFTVVSTDIRIIQVCEKMQISRISLSQLESTIEFDKEKYEKSIAKIEAETSKFQKEMATGQFLSILFSIAILLISFNIDKVLSFLSITAIIPISILISGLLFKMKKSQLFYYSIFEFISGLVIAYVIYHFYKNEELEPFFKLISLLSAIFICVRAFTNFDKYALENDNRISQIWNNIF